jgi:hypothetical protein
MRVERPRGIVHAHVGDVMPTQERGDLPRLVSATIAAQPASSASATKE